MVAGGGVMEDLMTAKEVAAVLGYCYHTILKMRKNGELTAVERHGRYRFDPADVRAYIEAQKGKPARAPRPMEAAA